MMPEFDGVHHFNLSVTDLDRSAAWYTEVLGVKHGWDMEDTAGRGRKVVLLHQTLPLRIVLTHHVSNDGNPASEFATGLDHLALTVKDQGVLEDWLQWFDQRGVDHSPIKQGATGLLITFRDPDNIQLEMYSRGE